MKHNLKTIASPNQWKVTFGLAKYILRSITRNKGGFFFGLIFPLIFVTIFGLFSNATPPTRIGIVDGINQESPVYTTLKKLSEAEKAPITLQGGSKEELTKKLETDKLDSILEQGNLPNDYTLITSNTNAQGKATSEAFVNGVVDKLTLQIAQAKPAATISSKEISGKSLSMIDFLLPGQVGFSLLSVATFGAAFSFLTLRKTLVLKRIFATTVSPFGFVVAQSLARSVQGVLQSLIIIAVGVWVFDFHLANGIWTVLEMCILAFFGVLSFLGFGILISNIAKDEQTMPIVLNLFNLPQMLLAGVFFSTDVLPTWLQHIGNNLPLAYLNQAMRDISVRGASFIDILPYLGGMAAWALVAYFFAARTFKSE